MRKYRCVPRSCGVAVVGTLCFTMFVVSPLNAQEFIPPTRSPRPDPVVEADGGSVGIAAFGAKFGWDFGGNGEPLVAVSVDLLSAWSDRVRLRSVVEIGFSRLDNTYVMGGELVYRYNSSSMPIVPFLGAGLALAGRDLCRVTVGCPAVWFQNSIGFEAFLRDNVNMMVEFRGENLWRRRRLFFGLITNLGG
ncbi:MAG: hypothetical protein OEZ54_10500 [Gemmatimonadota bacterium]|nr:hypothetical protein [Gemmatimonadota bacterium]